MKSSLSCSGLHVFLDIYFGREPHFFPSRKHTEMRTVAEVSKNINKTGDSRVKTFSLLTGGYGVVSCVLLVSRRQLSYFTCL